MRILELYSKDSVVPFALIGLDDDEKIFGKGIDEEYYKSFVEDGVEDENGILWKVTDGVKFLDAIRDKLMENVYEDEINIKGPFLVSDLPKLEVLEDDGKREVVPEDDDLSNIKGGEE